MAAELRVYTRTIYCERVTRTSGAYMSIYQGWKKPRFFRKSFKVF